MFPRCMTRNRAIEKVLMTFLLFLISGLVHQLTNSQLNPECRDYADILFFGINAVAVITESALLPLRPREQLSRNHKQRETGRRHTLQIVQVVLVRCLGYIWVVSFFIWVVPKLYYPRVYCTVSQLVQKRKTMA